MSINISTLHIGSHVLVDGKRVRVCGITKRKIGYHHPGGRKDTHLCYARLNEVEPIRITPELLTEIGFEHKDHGYFELWWKGGFTLTHKPESVYYTHDGGIDVEFLHELESLYCIIYGVELIKD